jgi:hypothetical protein
VDCNINRLDEMMSPDHRLCFIWYTECDIVLHGLHSKTEKIRRSFSYESENTRGRVNSNGVHAAPESILAIFRASLSFMIMYYLYKYNVSMLIVIQASLYSDICALSYFVKYSPYRKNTEIKVL